MPRYVTPILCLLLLLAIALVFSPVTHQSFISYDDGGYVTENPIVKQGLTWQGVRWAFTTGSNSNWHPLTWLSHMVDCQLYGLQAPGHKVTSLLLHAANSLVLLLLLKRLTGSLWRSALVAALFALHPLHVQSVAWVAERKDVLSTLLGFLAIAAYATYVDRPGWARYLGVVALFVLSLMAKPMLVTLPFLLLLLDYWPLERLGRGVPIGRLILEKVPLLVLAAASSVVTYLVQNASGAVQATDAVPLLSRFENAVVAYAAYLGKMIWPTRLVFFYAYPLSWAWWQVAGSAALLVGVTTGVVLYGRRYPFLPVSWFWFLGTLVPVIGLVQVGVQAMADRYSYVPLIGIFIALAWAIPDRLVATRALRAGTGASVAVLLAALGFWSYVQVGHWENDHTLFAHAATAAPDNFMARLNFGGVLAQEGRLPEALHEFQESIALRPRYARAHFNYAWTLAALGRYDEAITAYRRLLQLDTHEPGVHANLGAALQAKGRMEEAVGELRLALREEPNNNAVRKDLALALARSGHLDEAATLFRQALGSNAAQPDVQNNLGNVLHQLGQTDQALLAYRQAAALEPQNPLYHENAGTVQMERGQFPSAADELALAVRLNPASPQLRRKLAAVLLQMGQLDKAIDQIAAGSRQAPDNADLHALLGSMLAEKGRLPEAERELTEALRWNPNLAAAQAALQRVKDMQKKAGG